MTELGAILGQIRFMFGYQGVPILLSTAYVLLVIRYRSKSSIGLLPIYWIVSFLPVLGLMKVGAIHNYWIELDATNAVLSMLFLADTLSIRGHGLVSIARSFTFIFMIVQCVMVIGEVGSQTVREYHELQASLGNGQRYAQLLEMTRSTHGYVVSDELDLLVLSGKPVFYEPVILSILYSQGLWDPSRLTDSLCNGEVSLLVLRAPIETYSSTGTAAVVPFFPEPVLNALVRCMKSVNVVEDRYIYGPRLSEPSSGSILGT